MKFFLSLGKRGPEGRYVEEFELTEEQYAKVHAMLPKVGLKRGP